MLVLALILFTIFSKVEPKVECFQIVGKLKCPSFPQKANYIQIDLMDEDPLPLEVDDTMGRTWSDKSGNFSVSGCGSDFGPINTPDAYLLIYHSCPHMNGRAIPGPLQIDILPIFMPKIINIGSVYLDRYVDDDMDEA
ncbi:unnamed protein product [Auanema sp. JU1783]|nr:unnamed protein product [Auanema sp. JU1783]